MKTKELHRARIIEFLADPENPFLTWTCIGQSVLGHKNKKSIYHLLDSQERDEIFREALELRRKRYTCLLARVDRGLLDRAIAGDPAAAKLVYQRFEGWASTEKHEQILSFEDRLREVQEKRKTSAD